MDCRKGRRRAFTSATATALLCCSLMAFFFISSLWSSARADLGNPTSTPRVQGAAGRRRGLSGSGSGCCGGPGSYPPLCSAKCGECTPCNPVHEAVRPGQPAVEEYYPEAWRCKCGNKLYMP